MGIIGKIIIACCLVLMPVGLLLAVQGNYFYSITSKSSFDNLVDSVVEDMYQTQAEQYQELCQQYLNTTCPSMNETVNLICQKSIELKDQADQQSKEFCNSLNITCSTITEAKDKACQQFGSDSELCTQLSSAEQQIRQADEICLQLKSAQQQIENQKQELYYKPLVEDISLSKINTMFYSSVQTGIIIFILTCIIIFLVSRSFTTLFKSIAVTVLTTGLVCIAIWYFGRMAIEKMMPAGLTLPAAAQEFIQGIFQFEYSSGLMLTIAGLVLFVVVLVGGKIKTPKK